MVSRGRRHCKPVRQDKSAMSALGQNRKFSSRAHVVRFSPGSGHQGGHASRSALCQQWTPAPQQNRSLLFLECRLSAASADPAKKVYRPASNSNQCAEPVEQGGPKRWSRYRLPAWGRRNTGRSWSEPRMGSRSRRRSRATRPALKFFSSTASHKPHCHGSARSRVISPRNSAW
jgi:hypothetical protein